MLTALDRQKKVLTAFNGKNIGFNGVEPETSRINGVLRENERG